MSKGGFMNIHNFFAEEQEIINIGKNMTLQEFRRYLVFIITTTNDENFYDHLLKELFDKFRLITEREWAEIQKYMPFPGMRIDDDDIDFQDMEL